MEAISQRRSLGAILMESGRITQADVERSLEHQRMHGGFFGQALVSLGVLSHEEIDWALASHFDLPYIFPNADAVDRDAALMVAPDWALAHLAVPIVRAGRSLTVVVAEPPSADVIEDLSTRTGCDIELALASAARIRELIHRLYDSAQAQRIDEDVTGTFGELATNALEHAGERFGVSVRGSNAIGWWRTRLQTHRQQLAEGWEQSLAEMIQPSPLAMMKAAPDGRARYEGVLRRPLGDVGLDVQTLAGAGGCELMFLPHGVDAAAVPVDGIALPPNLVTELRLLARSGNARVGVGSLPVATARAVVPSLPTLALGVQARAAHISESGEGARVYTLRAERNDAFADLVASYELDALTLDLPAVGYPVQQLLRAAPISFMILDEPEERAAPGDWGINWLLTISGQPGSHAWDLRALHG
jgi:type IV pilus assembly protein PilB